MQAREAQNAQKSGRKLAKDVLDEFMHLTAGMAAFYQPAPPGMPSNQNESEEKFWQCVEMTRDFAKELAKYQSPTFKAIAVQLAPDQPAAPKQIEGNNVLVMNDPLLLTAFYKRRIARVG